MSKVQRYNGKYWCFTLNNYTKQEEQALKNWIGPSYIVFGYEVGEECGTPHLQGYVEFEKSIRREKISDFFPRMSLFYRLGTSLRASNYCKKGKQEKDEWEKHHEEGPNWGLEAVFHEKGTISVSEQGKRTDLLAIRDEIVNGRTVKDIAMEKPMVYHQYGRTLNFIEDIVLQRNSRTEMTQCKWYWGPTDVGKSHTAFENFSDETHYLWPNDGRWWDSYVQQETVIFNDFRGEIDYQTMLCLIDKWPYQVSRRGRSPMPFTSKFIIITSSLPPDRVYRRRLQEDAIEQLLRRIEVIHLADRKRT